MGPKSGWGGPVGIGYVRPVQFLDHLTVITNLTEYTLEVRVGFLTNRPSCHNEIENGPEL